MRPYDRECLALEQFEFFLLSSLTSLVVQWLRIRLPMQRTQVQSMVPEGPTCRGATKPTHHNY